MEPNLINLKRILENAFPNIEKHSIDKAVLVIGNTGCGKSTLLSALLFGPDVLEEKEIPETIRVKNKDGTFGSKIKKKKVIDYKDEQKTRVFPIGHKSVSETFLPSF